MDALGSARIRVQRKMHGCPMRSLTSATSLRSRVVCRPCIPYKSWNVYRRVACLAWHVFGGDMIAPHLTGLMTSDGCQCEHFPPRAEATVYFIRERNQELFESHLDIDRFVRASSHHRTFRIVFMFLLPNAGSSINQLLS